MKKDYTIKFYWLLYLMMIFSSMVVIQISRRELFLLLQILFCVLLFFYKKKVVLFEHRMINAFFISFALSALSACCSDLPYSYKKAAVVMTIFLVPLYFTLSYTYDLIKKERKILSVILSGFKAMCIIQLLWIPVQYVLYHYLNIDINQILFVDLFKFVENATFIRDWNFHPSGLTWHSAVLAPMFVIGFVLFKNPIMRLLIIFDAIICGNSTSLIGVLICATLLFFFYMHKNKIRVCLTKTQVVILGILLAIVLLIMFRIGLLNSVINRIVYLYMRVFGSQSDASTAAHFSYFTDYFKILPDSSWLQILVGYGYGCSGYPIGEMYNRYTDLANWAVECDIINILISRGVVGFVAHYTVLLYIVVKGIKIDYRYCAVMIPIIIQGIGYNVQWDYVIFMEIIMFLCVRMNINLFETNSNKDDVWVKSDNSYALTK